MGRKKTLSEPQVRHSCRGFYKKRSFFSLIFLCYREYSKSTPNILLYPWKRHFRELLPAWRPWQAILYLSHISIKQKKNSTREQYLGTPEVGRGNAQSMNRAFFVFLRVRRINITMK